MPVHYVEQLLVCGDCGFLMSSETLLNLNGCDVAGVLMSWMGVVPTYMIATAPSLPDWISRE